MSKLSWAWFMLQKKVLGRSDIYVRNKLYMRRWLLGPTWAPGLRLHNIVRSDSDESLHDHPFDYVSLILKGGYLERREGARQEFHEPGSLLIRKAESLHSLNLSVEFAPNWQLDPKEVPAWTLVLRGPYRREWGFMTKTGWMHWREFNEKTQGKPSDAPFAAKSSN